MKSKIVKNFSLYTIGQFLTQALSFILLPIYVAKLSQEQYGIVAFFMALGVLLNAIMQYGFGATLMRYYYDYNNREEAFKSFFSSLMVFMVLANVGIIAVVSLIYKTLFEAFNLSIDAEQYIYYVLGYSFLFTFPLLNLTLFRVKDQPKSYLLFNLTQFFLSFLAIYFFVAILEGGALGKIKGEFWARVPLFLVSLYLYYKYFTIRGLQWRYVKQSLNFGIPLMFQSILWWGLYRLDYFLIESTLNSQSLGLYNVGFQVSFVVITLGISFSLAWTPHFYSIAKGKSTSRIYGNLLGNFLMLLVLLATAILFFGQNILKLIGGDEYIGIFEFLPWLLIGAIFQSSYYLIHQTIQYSKKTISIPIILGLGVLIGFGFEYLIIQEYGLNGLSMVKCLTFMLVFLATFFVGQKYYKIDIALNKVALSFLFLLVNYLFTLFIGNDLWSIGIKAILIVANIAALWFVLPFFNKEEKDFIMRKIKTS